MRARVPRLVAVVVSVLAATVMGAAPASAEAGEPPFDPGADWTLTSSREDAATAPAEECATASEWTWSAGETELTLYQVPCTENDAASGVYEWLQVPGELVGGVSQEGELVLWAQDRVTRVWLADGPAENDALVVLTLTCAGAGQDDCLSDSDDLALAAMDASPGGRAGVDTPGFTIEAIMLALLVPVVLVALVVAPFRLVGRLARARYGSVSTSPRYHDVTSMVTRARWRRRIRRLLWWLLVFLVFVSLTSVTTRDTGTILGVLILALLPGIVLLIGYRTFLRPSPVERGRRNVSGQGAEAVIGSMLSVLSYAIVGLLLLAYVLASVYGNMSLGWPSLSGADVRRMGLPLLGSLRPLVESVGDDAMVVGLLLAIPVLIVVATVDGLGQRLRGASLDDALAQDDRPHYLYLRSFDEDTLSLPGQLRGRGLISVLAMRRKVRFEEVLVRQLSATGPVIAIAPPGSTMPPIGAARASFSNDEWQQHVTRYAETARAVVLSATPGQIRHGYGWELDLIANRISHQRVLVVLGPWPLRSLGRRWTQFCMAVSTVPFFAPITMPWVPDGIHVLAHSPRQGWQGWGARRRLDWTYAVAVDQATRAYLPDWS
ncbi:hypothetical protein [Pseudactinotalea suaedae]|jgi:hypothetical protein|uniref:hypothetical protein n=1 Tax=Pseudactinotalea suaedae TaxID=1524924 RepID=UPI0012E1D456|nr:hypothetical protein [Pseudactinotalea suaedae]